MRIAYFLTEFPALSQTFILNQITGMIDLGAEVEIFTFQQQFPEKVHDKVNEYHLLDKVRYLKPVPPGKVARIIHLWALFFSRHSLSTLWPILKALNVKRFGGAAKSLQLPADVLQCGSGRSFDIIHCQFGTIATRALSLIEVGALSGKLVTSFRGYDATVFAQQNPGVYDHLFDKGDIFLPVSQSLQKTITELGCPENRIKVLHSGIETERFSFRPTLFPADGQVNVITIGRLVEKKGIDIAIKAVARAIAAGKRLHYNIVGDGVLLEPLKALAHELGIEANVSFLGWQTHADIVTLLNRSHILVAPSITPESGDQEGIPNVLKEGMAVGLPVIGTYHGGTPELIEHGKRGFLVAEKDIDALADTLVYLYEHPGIWADISTEARSFVEAEFDNTQINKKLYGLYQSLITTAAP